MKAAAVVNNLPLSGSSTTTVYKDVDGSIFGVMTRTISPNYFAVMGTPLIEGRVFKDADQADSPRVAIINEYLAQHLFPGRDPFLPMTTRQFNRACPMAADVAGLGTPTNGNHCGPNPIL